MYELHRPMACIAGLIAVSLAAACTSTGRAPPSTETISWVDSHWSALLIDDTATLMRGRPTVDFVDNLKVRGYASCNSFFGSVRVYGSSMRFLDIGTHLVGCEPKVLEQEKRFLAALDAVRSFRIESGRLMLLDETKAERLLLERRTEISAAPRSEARAVARISAPANASAYASSKAPSLDGPRNPRVAELELVTISAALGEYFGALRGALVVSAPSANIFGLEDGDVIVAINGRTAANAAHAIRILDSYRPGEPVHLDVIRKHQPAGLDMTLPP